MSRTIGSGGVKHIEAQAARLRHLADEIQRDLNTWREHLPAVTVAEVEERIARHSAEARELEAIILRARWPEECMVPAHFAEAGDELGHRVGG